MGIENLDELKENNDKIDTAADGDAVIEGLEPTEDDQVTDET